MKKNFQRAFDRVLGYRLAAAVSLVSVAASAFAQDGNNDSTDIFFGHLKLNELIVVGSTGETPLRESSGPVAVLGPADKARHSSTNVIDAISLLPGVSQITTGGGISKPVIRGLGYNRVLTVADGIRQEGQQWGDEHGIEVDEATVTSVEVLKGPASLVYGSDALAGVVRLNTAPDIASGRRRASVSAQWQSNPDLLGYSANWTGNSRGNIWDLRYSGKFAHAYKNARDGYVPGTQFSEQAVRALGGLNRRWGHSHLIFSFYHLTPTLAEGERDAETGRLELPDGDVKTYRHGMPYQRVRHYKLVSDNRIALGGGRLNALLGYQLNQRKEYEDDPEHFGLYLKLHTFTANVAYNKRQGPWRWTAGVSAMYQKSVNGGEEYLIPDHHLFDAGVFATVNRTFGEHWNVSAGLRYDHRHLVSHSLMEEGELRFADFKRNMGSVSGSVGAVWHAGRHVDVRMNVAHGFRAPNISELACNGRHEGTFRYEVGDQALNPEHSWQFDLGIDWSSRYVTASLSLFANLVDNYIYLERRGGAVIDGADVFDYRAGDARLLGGELSVDFHPLHALHLGTTLGLVHGVLLHQPSESRYLPMIPAMQWNVDAKYEITHDGRTFSNAFVALTLANTFAQTHCHTAGGTEWATPAYTLLGAQVGSDIMYRGRRVATVTLIGDNLTDKAYQSHLSRFKHAPENPVTRERGICNMGRNITVKLEIPIEW